VQNQNHYNNYACHSQKLNLLNKLFKPAANLAVYNQFISNLRHLELTSCFSKKMAILAYIILFNFEGLSDICVCEKTLKTLKLSRKLLLEGYVVKDSSFGLRDLMSTLYNMSAFYNFNVFDDSQSPSSSPHYRYQICELGIFKKSTTTYCQAARKTHNLVTLENML